MCPDSLHYAGSVLWNSRLPQPPATQNPFTSLLVRKILPAAATRLSDLLRGQRSASPASPSEDFFSSSFFFGFLDEFTSADLWIWWIFQYFESAWLSSSSPLCVCVCMCVCVCIFGRSNHWIHLHSCSSLAPTVQLTLWTFSPDVPIPESRLIWET